MEIINLKPKTMEKEEKTSREMQVAKAALENVGEPQGDNAIALLTMAAMFTVGAKSCDTGEPLEKCYNDYIGAFGKNGLYVRASVIGAMTIGYMWAKANPMQKGETETTTENAK